jgi:hypothetical protein
MFRQNAGPREFSKAQWICEDLLELRVPASIEYVNFKRKTEKKCDMQCDDVAATRKSNAPWAVASNRRTGDAK